MSTLIRARRYLSLAPADALGDVVGLVALCALFIAGFTLPGLL